MNKSKVLSFLLKVFLFLVTSFSLFSANFSLDLESENVICINGKTGQVLFEKNADAKIYPASVTKIASGLFSLVKKKGSHSEKIRADKEALVCVHCLEKRKDNYANYPGFVLELDGVTSHIAEGEILSYNDLIHIALIHSANDASNVLAQYHGNGSIDAFMGELNAFVQKLGCKNTHFCNPHGLHHPDHYTTARDMATIAKYAMVHPVFSEIIKKPYCEIDPTNKSSKRIYRQKNRLLVKGEYYYPFACGIKIGYTQKARKNVIAAAQKGDRFLICAVMNCQERFGVFKDAKKVFEAVFKEEIVNKEIVPKGHMLFKREFSTSYDTLQTYTKSPFTISFYPSEEPVLRCMLTWEEVNLPVEQGTKVATLQILNGDTLIGTHDLFAENTVKKDFWLSFKEYISLQTVLLAILGVTILFGLIYIFKRR